MGLSGFILLTLCTKAVIIFTVADGVKHVNTLA